MIILVTGGSGSGKSEYAENLAVKLHRNNLIYIAAMMPQDEESIHRIARHRELRKDKGFHTIECYTGIKELGVKNKKHILHRTDLDVCQSGQMDPKAENRPTVLLECMSNLLANEMYSDIGILHKDGKASVCDEIMEGITHLDTVCEYVIIVSNEVFSDNGSPYEETTNYINRLGEINCRIGSLAACVYEVVCGIPVCQKGLGVI